MLQDAIDLASVRRILLVKLRHHGDVLLTSPVLSSLRAVLPAAEIDALVYADTAPMLAGHVALSHLWTVPRQSQLRGFARLKQEWQLVQQLKARDFDLLIHLTESRRGAWLARFLSPKYSVAPAGKFGKFFAKSFTHRYPVIGGNRRHTVEIHLDALRRLGICPPEDSRALSIAISAQDQASAAAKLAAKQIVGDYLLVHPTSRWMFKTWAVENMAALLTNLQACGLNIILTAAPDTVELAYIAALQAKMPKALPCLAGELSLKELAALIAGARVFLGMDSVPMHLAAATQTPTVALFGPSGHIEWAPWQVRAEILTAGMSCQPCGKDGCGGSKISDCLNAISVERVARAVLALWQEETR